MYLKSLTLKGFKSFAERTRLEFGPGVSVIVGPNGSGKSNITDAVLWALGEQSPVAVRGQSMQDVIFGGSRGRQAAKAAEVELVLDDSDGVLDLGAPEVSILRRLDRAGEGEYRLAGARCRLVDVIEVLSDTGLGKEMHSVISQGRVESIVTSKPRDRRLLIEEAAGLGKHRKRRRRAQLKLERTQSNLDRALDVEREARSRLRPLKRQAEAAELHARIERQMVEARWELARDRLRSTQLAVADAQAASTLAREQREQVEQSVAAVATRRQAAEQALAARSAQREELSRRCFVAQSAADRISYRADGARSAAATVSKRLGHGREHLEALLAHDAADRPDPAAQARIAQLEASLAELARDAEVELARQLFELEQQLATADAACSTRAAVVERAAGVRAQAEERVEQARVALKEAERGAEAARRESARVGGELAAVNQFLRSHASASHGAVVLADELSVAPGFELALAAVLDGRLRAAVVEDRVAAAALLERVGADGGRALIAAPAPGPTPEGDGEGGGGPVAGAERLLDHVRGTERAVALARLLLADAWVLDTLDALPESFIGVAVTRGGRVWSAAGRELRQAPSVGEERVLAERNRRDALVRASEAAAGTEVQARAAVQQAGAELSRLDGERDQAVGAHRTAVRGRDEAIEERRRIQAQIERRRAAPDEGPTAARRAQLSAELSAQRGALARAERARVERAAQIERLQATIAANEALAPALGRVIEALERAAGAIGARRAVFQSELAADREAGEHVAAQLRECAQQEAQLHTQLHRCSEALTETEVRLQRVRDQAAEASQELRDLAAQLELSAEPADEALAQEQRDALTTRLERLVRRREQLGPVNPLAQEEYAEALAHVEELERQRADLETALRELHKLIADTDRQIRQTFEQTFEAAARNFEDVAAQLFPGGRGRLTLVTERDGPAAVLGGPRPARATADGADGAVDG
ncbi:MAG: AAA family ATPase, partial [Solirubrobacteraceae bacterium]